MKALFCIIMYCCYPIFSQMATVCKDYLDGNVPQHSISLVETLTVSELIRVVMLHFRDTETPCHEHRSWYTGYTRLGTIVYENRSENDGTIACVSQTILNITEDTFTPKLDVIYSRVNGDYSTVKPICIENETAYYIKLQRGNPCPKISNTGDISLKTIAPSRSAIVTVTPSHYCPSVSTTILTSTSIVSEASMTTGISVSKVTVTNTMTNIVTVAPENDANTACMTYILPSLLAVIGVLVGLVIVTATAMFLYIRCSQNKHDIKNAGAIDHGIRNPTFGADDTWQGEGEMKRNDNDQNCVQQI